MANKIQEQQIRQQVQDRQVREQLGSQLTAAYISQAGVVYGPQAGVVYGRVVARDCGDPDIVSVRVVAPLQESVR